MIKKIINTLWFATIVVCSIIFFQKNFMAPEQGPGYIETMPSEWPALSDKCVKHGVYERTVKIDMRDGQGSGVILDASHILAVAHLESEPYSQETYTITSYKRPYNRYTAHVVEVDYYNDVMLLKFDEPVDLDFKDEIKVKMRVPGNTVVTMGYHPAYTFLHGLLRLPSAACYEGIATGRYYAPGWESHSFVWPGMSGGPVVDDTDGSLIGLNNIVAYQRDMVSDNTLYVRFRHSQHATGAAIARMLDKHNIDFTIIRTF
jgi:S1-C subfamily serine protease